jgi:hypothetical protein
VGQRGRRITSHCCSTTYGIQGHFGCALQLAHEELSKLISPEGRPPSTHRAFSHLPYNPPNSETSRATELNEDDEAESQPVKAVSRSSPRMRGLQAPTLPPPDNFWRLEDDIEEF